MRLPFRDALTDLYFNSWRLVPANLIWGFVLLGVLAVSVAFPPALVLLVLLAVPTAGLHRMAALLARDEHAGFSDFIEGMRRYAAPAVAIGLAAALLAAVFTTNVVLGVRAGNPPGWFLAVMALYGDVALATFLISVWPVLVDPHRDELSLRRRLTLAGLIVVARPIRLLALLAIVMVILALSIVVLGAIVLVSAAFVSLLATRTVLPMVDAMEARFRVAVR